MQKTFIVIYLSFPAQAGLMFSVSLLHRSRFCVYYILTPFSPTSLKTQFFQVFVPFTCYFNNTNFLSYMILCPPVYKSTPLLNFMELFSISGAGVSVSCGIPDFRSRDGIYSRLAIDFPNLPDPQAMFDINYFKQDPRPFFKFAREIYPGQFKPSPCHRWAKKYCLIFLTIFFSFVVFGLKLVFTC